MVMFPVQLDASESFSLIHHQCQRSVLTSFTLCILITHCHWFSSMANTKYFNIRSSFIRNKHLTLLTVLEVQVKTFNIRFSKLRLITVAVWKAVITHLMRGIIHGLILDWRNSWVWVLKWQKWMGIKIKNVSIRKLSVLKMQNWLKALSIFFAVQSRTYLFYLVGKQCKCHMTYLWNISLLHWDWN